MQTEPQRLQACGDEVTSSTSGGSDVDTARSRAAAILVGGNMQPARQSWSPGHCSLWQCWTGTLRRAFKGLLEKRGTFPLQEVVGHHGGGCKRGSRSGGAGPGPLSHKSNASVASLAPAPVQVMQEQGIMEESSGSASKS